MKQSLLRRMAMGLLLCLALGCLSSAGALEADVSGIQALAIDNLSTRSGPSTAYRETGTYRVKDQWIRILSYAYDQYGVCWVQCEVPYGNKLRRVYTGLKRFDDLIIDFSGLSEEDPSCFERVRVRATSKALYGPGKGYDTYPSLTVDKRQTVSLVAVEGDYAHVEWTTSKQSYRAWVLLSTLDY